MWSSHATRREVPYQGLHARQPHRAVLLHTNGGGTDRGSLYGWWTQVARRGQHIGAHFQIATNGHAEQYADTSLVVYHAYSASEWAVGIETEDDGHPSTPWTDAQVATIIAICRELHVPGRILTSPAPADGLGWHEQFVDWNHDGHQCPGPVRELQIRRDILPALLTHPTPPPAPTPSPVQEDDVRLYIVDGTKPVWITNGIERRWVQTPDDLTQIERDFGVKPVVLPHGSTFLDSIPIVGAQPH